MFDTITVHASIKNIQDNAELIVNEPAFDYKSKTKANPVILWKDAKKIIEGSKAFCNSDNFNLTLKRNLNPHSQNDVVSVLSFSLPKQLNPTNVRPVDDVDFPKAIIKLTEKLEEKGFDIDIENSRIIRFDVAANVDTVFKSNQFVNLFQSLNLSRMKKQIYPSSLLFYNSNIEFNAYDKPKEQGLIPKNSFSETARFELRTKNAKTCAKNNDLYFLKDLYFKYKPVMLNYKEFVLNRFFKTIESDSSVVKYDYSAILDYFKAKSKRNFVQTFTHYIAYCNLQHNDQIPDYLEALKKNSVTRNNLSLIQRKFESFEIVRKQFEGLKKGVNFSDYVQTLKNNFLKATA